MASSSVIPQDKAYPAVRRMQRGLSNYERRMARITAAVVTIDAICKEGAPTRTFGALMQARRGLLKALEIDGEAARELVELRWIMRDTDKDPA